MTTDQPTPAPASPAISVGLPVYNGEAFLDRAIASVLRQTWTDFELILVDNASSDDTEKICRERAASDSRIRYFRHDENIGAGPNFNFALEQARADYFCWLAHDDWFGPAYLDRCLEALREDSGRVLSYAMQGVVDDSGEVFREQREYLRGLDNHNAVRRFHSIIWKLRDPTSPVFGLMPTDVLRRIGGLPLVPEPDRHMLYALSLEGRFHTQSEISFFHYGPPGHTAHYGSGRMRRRSWEWLHPDFARQPMRKPLRAVQAELAIVTRSNLSAVGKAACLADALIAAIARRTYSKARRAAKRSWRRARRAVPAVPEQV